MPFSLEPTMDSRPPHKTTTTARRILYLALSSLAICTASTVAVCQQPFGFPPDESVPWAPGSGTIQAQQPAAQHATAQYSSGQYSSAPNSSANRLGTGIQPGAIRQASTTSFPRQLPQIGSAGPNTGTSRSAVTQAAMNAGLVPGAQNPLNFDTGAARSPVFGAGNRLTSQPVGSPADGPPLGVAAGHRSDPTGSATADAGFDPASLSGSAGEMISFSYLDGSGRQIVTVIHAGKLWMTVYHIERSGVIHLVSSREIGPDFGLLLNATSPLPDEIRQLGSPAR